MTVLPVLGIVPARRGSKGVPRKNLRTIAGRPLLAYSVDAAIESGVVDRLVVSSDDAEVLNWAAMHGVEALARPPHLADDRATIADVAAAVADELRWEAIVAVFQPTSPLRSPDSIKRAIDHFRASGAASLATVVRESHLFWFDATGDLEHAHPLFTERVNRQFGAHRVMRETGSIQLIHTDALRASGSMVAEPHVLFELPASESVDVDTLDDLAAVRRRLEQGSVVFRLRANRSVGLGHLYHCMSLAEELVDQQIAFLLVDCDPIVGEMLAERGYTAREELDLSEDLAGVRGPGPALVVNDVLDTSAREILIQKAAGFQVVCVEDLGPGTRYADWVVNALYLTEPSPLGNISFGPSWATLRSEFRDLPEKEIRTAPERVVLTFGGTDPGGFASRFGTALAHALDEAIELVIVQGPGATDALLPARSQIRRHVRSMAAEMMGADVVVTSAGRTVYEAAATGTPVIVVAQNAREATHAHLGYDNGVVFLGLGTLLEDHQVVDAVRRLLLDAPLRRELSSRLRGSIDHRGAERISHRIRDMMRGL